MSYLFGGLISSQSLHAHRPQVHGLLKSDHKRVAIILARPKLRNVCKLECATRPEVANGTVSLYAISDLHTDHHANMSWVQQLPSYTTTSSGAPAASNPADTSVLLVAGDISDDMGLIRATLEALRSKFHVVAFIPGNHELWVKGHPGSQEAEQRNAGATDSVDKLHKVLQLCEELDVMTQPAQIGGLYIVPLLAWHHQCWDKEADIPGIPRAGAMTIADYAACVWPEGVPGSVALGAKETAAWFDEANENLQQPGWTRLQQVLQNSRTAAAPPAAGGGDVKQWRQQQQQQRHVDVVSCSHFLPHQDLLPEKRFLSYPNLAKAVGSDYLWQRVRQLQPDLHIFGHSHFAWDSRVEGIRCIQAPLCYPNERRHRVKSVILQNTPHVQHSSSSSGSSDGQQQRQSVEAQDHHVANVPWLPVRVYQACYTAERVTPTRQQGASCSSGTASSGSRSCANLLLQHGLPVLHDSQLQQQQQQSDQLGLGAAAAADSTSEAASVCDGSAATEYYRIMNWHGSWCPNLFGVWSEYYKVTPRDPGNTDLAPWVAKRYQKYPRLAQRLAASSSS